MFTHQVWEMQLYAATVEAGTPLPGWLWISREDMDTTAIPSAMKAARSIVETAWKGGDAPWLDDWKD